MFILNERNTPPIPIGKDVLFLKVAFFICVGMFVVRCHIFAQLIALIGESMALVGHR